MMLFKRLKNLWDLSRFSINRFDHELVITERDGKLTYARPENDPSPMTENREPRKMAQIIRKQTKDPVEEIING